MKYWFGYPMLECECGFSTPDEDEFQNHLKKHRHKQKLEASAKVVKKSVVNKKTKEVKGEENA